VRDTRVERYAELLLGTCLGVERGWQVIVWGTPWARPLLEEVMKQLGERGAYPLLRLTFSGAMRNGREVRGIRLRFSEGRIVEASAESEEDFLLETLDTDLGARRIGELGIGCNPGINRYMRNIYFDKKMNGAIHVALDFGFDYILLVNSRRLTLQAEAGVSPRECAALGPERCRVVAGA
jgi:leucyl aminopeptidase (aminopeptidase T)